MFPFTVGAIETPGYTSSPYDFRKAFSANKPEGVVWYAYDVVVKSPTLVEFVVYSMRDMCFGGIGEQIATFDAIVDRSVTGPAMLREATRTAQYRRFQELEAAEAAIVARYAREIIEAVVAA